MYHHYYHHHLLLVQACEQWLLPSLKFPYFSDIDIIIGAVGGACALIVLVLTALLIARVCVLKKQKAHKAVYEGIQSLHGKDLLTIHCVTCMFT